MANFEDYDRVSDTLMYLSDNITLEFVVALSKKNASGERSFFHYETEYQSKYIGTNVARSIKRNMNFYFVLNNKMDFANGFILRPQDVAILTMAIEQRFLPYYFSEKKIFKVIENQLVLKGNFNPLLYAQNQYKFIKLSPIVCQDENGYKEGVRIEINNDYVDMDIDKFMGVYYILKNTDMYSTAVGLTTYVKTGPHGINNFPMKGLGGGSTPDDSAWRGSSKSAKDFLDNIKTK